MSAQFLQSLSEQTEALKSQGLYKSERLIAGPQQAAIDVRNNGGVQHVLNLCANNYLGLANHPEVIAAAHKALDEYGYGMASVRFICGTQTLHKELESIIDGIRLSKAQRFRYQHNDMHDLQEQLQAAKEANARLVVTDGVFSMDGTIADLKAICDLADSHDALTMIDDCHASGFLGKTGRGTHEFRDVMGRIDIITGTLGKALGGASGGFTSGRKEIVGWLRQRSRPYLFSNSVAPTIVAASIAVFDLLERDSSLRERLHENAAYFRRKMTERGFDLKPGEHPIIPVMLGDAKLATAMADKLLERGIYVVGFSFPVVPEGQARIRTQMSAGLTQEQLDQAVEAFTEIGRELKVIS